MAQLNMVLDVLLALVGGVLALGGMLGYVTHLRRQRLARREQRLAQKRGTLSTTALRSVLKRVDSPAAKYFTWRDEATPEPRRLADTSPVPSSELVPGPLITPLNYEQTLLYADELARQWQGVTIPMRRVS